MKDFFSIAIDGPSGAGKSTLARMLASALNFLYVDTGAIYRTIGLAAYRLGIDRKNEAAVMELAPSLDIRLGYNAEGEQRMYLNGEDVSAEIRFPEISMCASDVSAHGRLREYLLEMQRKLARENNVIMDGRDISTVVLPDAELKIFLTATPEERARRRMNDLAQKGTPEPFEKVLEDIIRRDAQDTGREAAPLRKAEDAILVDTSELNLEESFNLLYQLAVMRLSSYTEGMQ